MRRYVLVVSVLAGCALGDGDEDLSEVESAGTSYQGTSYQGTSYQGTSYQGTSYQGTSYQGTSYQGTSYQGATYGSIALSSATVGKTTITTWRQLSNGNWERRMPASLCTFNSTKTALVTPCTTYNLSTSSGALAGVRFQATFQNPDGTTRQGTLRIASADIDTSLALHDGITTGDPTQYGGECTNPYGCRQNLDLYLYRVELVDTDGTRTPFCKGDGLAYAIAGSWSSTGAYTTSSSTFTFACTNGTIAKCTSWGYRPFGSAYNSAGSYISSTTMRDYHAACIRAATADYCANGTSFTKDGTLIEIYDFHPHMPSAAGLVPRTVSVEYLAGKHTTMFVGEANFDKHGATELDFLRYQELTNTSGYGSLEDPALGCPGLFSLGTAPQPGEYHRPRERSSPAAVQPLISVDNTRMCAHSEQTVGRYLHPNCSRCTYHLWDMFGDELSCLRSDGSWDSTCVGLANTYCSNSSTNTYAKMATHSECATGSALYKYDSACALTVCSDSAYASCCTSSWTSSCVAAANARCTGGREGGVITPSGFCGMTTAGG